jgi:hypothetical protein
MLNNLFHTAVALRGQTWAGQTWLHAHLPSLFRLLAIRLVLG